MGCRPEIVLLYLCLKKDQHLVVTTGLNPPQITRCHFLARPMKKLHLFWTAPQETTALFLTADVNQKSFGVSCQTK